MDSGNKPLTSNASLTIVGEVNRLRIHTTPNYIKKIQKFDIGDAEWPFNLTIYFVAVRNQTKYQNIIRNTNSKELVRELEEPDDPPILLHIHNGTLV